MHSIVDNIQIEQVLHPQIISSSALNSGNMDRQGAENLAVAVLVGDISETLSGSAKIELKIEHAEDDGTGAPGAYTACTDADVLNFSGLVSGVFASIDADAEETDRYVIEYIGGKRFVKVTATPTGLSTGGAIAMASLKGGLSQKPASNA